MRDPAAFFWERVDQSGGDDACWPWTGAVNKENGYGQMSVNGTTLLAHRFAYELLVGEIPDGLTVDHLCQSKTCMNAPRCMETVTRAENLRRRHTSQTHCLRGHAFDDENTYWYQKNGHDCRGCRACRREQQATYKKRIREKRGTSASGTPSNT